MHKASPSTNATDQGKATPGRPKAYSVVAISENAQVRSVGSNPGSIGRAPRGEPRAHPGRGSAASCRITCSSPLFSPTQVHVSDWMGVL